ncbi:DUF6083 domain-containing protein [Streptomyces sp. NPDC102384]|uniref:DUF6083 domain-containing protein n=1 Tax=Streptomyces sp. NPDC102384 TaxID=3366166 RepID=UPI0038296D8D
MRPHLSARTPEAGSRRSRHLPCTTLHVPGSLPRTGRCRRCGNPVAWHPRRNQHHIALHPAELPTAHVPESWRWHLSSGIAHPHAGGQAWCRIPHTALCPARTTPPDTGRRLHELRRQLALRSRRLIDTAAFTPPPAPAHPTAAPAEKLPVIQLLLGRYLADDALERIRCVARTEPGQRRCPHPVLNPQASTGAWRLLPLRHERDAGPTPSRLLAVYDLTRAPAGEQQRWRAQLCPRHATVRPDLNRTGWQVFTPNRHAAHIRTRLPHADGRTPA